MSEAKIFPWYDSEWLTAYVAAREYIEKNHPDRLGDFNRALEPFKTSSRFETKKLGIVFSQEELESLRALVREATARENHELSTFGRFVLRDLPFLSRLQESLLERVSLEVGEQVEPAYNFLSMYRERGICPLHMDAPLSKWTLDVCLDQSEQWPIYIGQVEPWPTERKFSSLWQEQVRAETNFQPFFLKPGEGIIFSGSSQWHYRDPIPQALGGFCDLVFFHFVPKGTKELALPVNWSREFALPNLRRASVYL